MAKGIQREPFAHAMRSLARHTAKMGSPTLVLVTHFAAEIMLIAFLWDLNVTSPLM
jgi:ABC-type molybdenum transport system ATPase subunit/photorepair protein PhrA